MRGRGKSRVQRHCGRSGRGVNLHNGPRLCQRANKLCKPTVGVLKSGKGGCEPVAEIRQVSNSEKVGVKKRKPFQVPDGFKHKRRLPRPSLALYDDVLSGFYVGREAAFKIWAWAEKLAVNNAAVFEWIHDFLLCAGLLDTIWYDTIWCDTIWRQFGSLSNFLFGRKDGAARNLPHWDMNKRRGQIEAAR